MAVYGPVRHQKNIIWTEASDHMTQMKLPATSRLKTCDNIVTCLDCNTDFSEEETNFYNVRDACHGHV